jgi:TFIIF-interacting CTD phosphatase-like protein
MSLRHFQSNHTATQAAQTVLEGQEDYRSQKRAGQQQNLQAKIVHSETASWPLLLVYP